ncbi:MAG: hypothetical protein QOD92_3933 [Acidimicrobiaceae bacterium]|jgi:hypothetical protein
MAESNRPEDFATRLADIESQLRILGTAPRATHTSVKGGSFTILDDAGKTVVVLDRDGLKMYDATGQLRTRAGYINVASGYGLSVLDAAGALHFEVNDDGYRQPWLATPWRDNTFSKATASGAFVALWAARMEILESRGVSTWLGWQTDGATTGEIRLRSSGGSTTNAVAVAAGASGSQQFRWLHGGTLNTGPFSIFAEARVTGGPGSVHLYDPDAPLYQVDELVCTATGL